MQIRVLFEKREAPWGGGNQFLSALDHEFRKGDYPSAEPTSYCVLVNSHHFESFFSELRVGISSGARVIHRLDGPISSTRKTLRGLLLDIEIVLFSLLVADGVVFQSDWSKLRLRKLGLRPKRSDVIHNAPDSTIFNRLESGSRKSNRKLRVVVTSWSTNSYKGFDSLEKIAAALDKEKFEFVFIGNSPRPLDNFVHHSPMASEPLAQQLKLCDVYLSASENDSCSNSLLEAIHCGLVPVAIDSGGNRELVEVDELLFKTVGEAVVILNKNLEDLQDYAEKIPIQSLKNVAARYVDFAVGMDNSPNALTRRIRYEIFVALHYLLRLARWTLGFAARMRLP